MDYWGPQLLNGLSFGSLLFLLSSGFTLAFGLMKVVNIAHGSFYMLGAYVALWVVKLSGYFALGIVAGALTVALIGVLT